MEKMEEYQDPDEFEFEAPENSSEAISQAIMHQIVEVVEVGVDSNERIGLVRDKSN